jgi:hypothetical protein
MKRRTKPFLAAVGGETLPPPAETPRKAKRAPIDREGTAIAAAHTIEQLLPAYVELTRVWAIGASKASAYHDANAESDRERYHHVPSAAANGAEAIRELSGANAAQRAMTALHAKMETSRRLIEIAPVSTIDGLRAKTLAAMWERVPGLADHVGFDFGDDGRDLEMLFRACVSITGLSELATRLEGRLRKEEA